MNYDRINEILAAFSTCELFDVFTQAEKTQLARQSRIITYAANQEVFSFEHKGEECFFLVADGMFKLQLRTKQSTTFKPGDLFGEIAIFHEKSRTGTIHAVSGGSLVAICRDTVRREGLLPSELRYKLTYILAQKMASYFYDTHLVTSRDLIIRGESETVEFKSSIQRKEEIVQSLCAFMNHRGGTVFVGVDDNGRVHGIGEDISRAKIDEYRRVIGTCIKRRIGSFDIRNIHIDAEKVFGKIILRIDCDPAGSPVYYKTRSKEKGEQEILIARHDTRNEVFDKFSEAVKFIQKRFGG